MVKKMKRIIALSLSTAACGILFGKASLKFIAVVIVAGIILSCLVYLIEKYVTHPTYHFVHAKYVILDVLIAVWFMSRFYSKWATHSAVMTLASTINIPIIILVGVSALIIGIIGLHAIDSLLYLFDSLVMQIVRGRFGIENPYNLPAVLIIVLMQNIMLNYSALQTFESIGRQSIVATALTTVLVLAVNFLLALIIRNWKVSLIFTTILFWIWSVADFYVVKFHGSPLYFSEFANAKTAANVMSGYQLEISAVVIIISIIAIAMITEIILFVSSSGIFKKESKAQRIVSLILMLILCVVLSVAGYHKVDPKSHGWAPWPEGLEAGGFLFESIYDLEKRQNPIVEPEGYNIDSIQKLKSDKYVSKDYPDVIVILNETFCDLSYSVNYKSDADPLVAFKNIEGAVYGHATVANIGGGTNDSEFELLTSNSRYLLNSSAPFTFLSEKQLKNSVVRFLKEGFGYETTGMHCGTPGNYSRNTAYPILGFDNIYLGRDDFLYQNNNGNRIWLDEDNYHDLTDHYEEGGEGPRFFYLLTYQNHGGYEQNEDPADTVLVETDFGAVTDDVNEYLSSIKLSAEAFRELTDYFKDSQRDVIICMVGDHAPSIISDLPNDVESPITDSNLNKCTVPYVVWSNFDADVTSYTDYMSMTDLVPMTLKAAGLPLSAFYNTVLNLHEEYPIRTKSGRYYDRDFKSGSFGADSEIRLLSDYYYMEYNSLHAGDDYLDDLFLVSKK